MRLPDWQARFSAVIKDYQRSPFMWGAHDCCLFACDSIQAITGSDPAAEFRGRYQTPREAYKRIREFCGGGVADLADTMAERFGFLPIKPVFAQRGDVGMFHTELHGETLGVCLGPHFAFVGADTMAYLPAAEITRAWRIG